MCEVLDRVENRGITIGEQRGIAIGEKRGISIGEQRGEKRGREKMADEINQLNSILLEQNRIDDLKRAVSDADYQRQLMAEFGIGDSL